MKDLLRYSVAFTTLGVMVAIGIHAVSRDEAIAGVILPAILGSLLLKALDDKLKKRYTSTSFLITRKQVGTVHSQIEKFTESTDINVYK